MDIRNVDVDTSSFDRSAVTEVKKVKLTPAGCAVDIGDGSERAEYVCQDYMINKLGRPHRNISLMYTYYPKDKEWPQRISEAHPEMKISYQWEYPYDDYPIYGGGIGGSLDNAPFTQMRDIRSHGQDVSLTLTIDCTVEDEHLIRIAKDLRNFGRMRLRINHECAGTWFTHNRRFTYKEISDFFVKFHKIIKEYAPNVMTVFCSGFVLDDGKMDHEEDFLEAFKVADVWSGDRYIALHSAWPFSICEEGEGQEYSISVADCFELFKNTTARLKEINGGVQKPFSASEFNIDGDVTGAKHQADGIIRFAEMLKKEKPDWFNNLSLYQFRDRGRLGLELEDPNNSSVGIEQPMLEAYKEMIKDPYFNPGVEETGSIDLNDETPIEMRWGSAEDSDGIEMKVRLEKTPYFFDMVLPKEQNLMISVNGRWFYKSPGVSIIDVMPAFLDRGAAEIKEGQEISVLIFAPPAGGENKDDGRSDWDINYYTQLNELPRFRIKYNPMYEVL